MNLIKQPNLKCYCGKPTTIYSGLFDRGFCSDECAENLRVFFGSIDAAIEIAHKSQICGEFKITGPVVTLANGLLTAKRMTSVIDKIEAKVVEQLNAESADAKARRDLKKLGLDDKTIEAMLQAKKG